MRVRPRRYHSETEIPSATREAGRAQKKPAPPGRSTLCLVEPPPATDRIGVGSSSYAVGPSLPTGLFKCPPPRIGVKKAGGKAADPWYEIRKPRSLPPKSGGFSQRRARPMLNANRISETPSPEAGVSRDLGAIVAWLRGLSRAEIGD